MAQQFFNNQNADIPFRNEVAFDYKGETYKVHVHKVVEGSETLYKLFFKNNILNTNKSIMKLQRIVQPNGQVQWQSKADYFSIQDNDMAVTAGAAIDKVIADTK